jgi:hypothetical protein
MKRLIFALGLVAMLSLSATAFAEGTMAPDSKSAPAKEKKKDDKKKDEKKEEKK